MNAKHLVASLLILFTAVTSAGVASFLTQETRDWSFIQTVGGMKVSLHGSALKVDCNVSGMRKITVEPTMINSGLAVRKLKHKRVGQTIQLRLVTSVIEKGMSTSPKPVDLSPYPAGDYEVQYLDSDGTAHPLGKISLAK